MAELRDILQDNDFTSTFRSVNILPNNPSRAQIEDVLSDNGITIPLTKSVRFYLIAANGKAFVVIYNVVENEFYFEKFSKAT